MRRTLRPSIAAVAVGLLLSGCGGEVEAPGPQGSVPSPAAPSAGPGGETLRACDLLTGGEAAGALGGGPIQATAADRSRCSWASPSGMVTATILGGDCPATPPEGSIAVESLGVPAWWTYVQAEVGVGTLTACPESVQLEVAVTGSRPEGKARASARALAAIALERLTG